MKLKRILTIKLSRAILLVVMLIQVSCKAQSYNENCEVFEYRDVENRVYTKIYNCKNSVNKQSYINLKEEEIIVCYQPAIEASVFDNDTAKFRNFILENLKWPKKDVEGTVILVVLIDEFGKIVEMRIVKGIEGCLECNNYALELVEIMPDWKPAICNNKTSKSLNYIKVPFRL